MQRTKTTVTRSEPDKPTITFSRLAISSSSTMALLSRRNSTDPLELIIWENIAYLASDKRRAEAFATLKQTIGTRPEQILAAQHAVLAAICKAGILPEVSAEKLLTIAKISYEEFGSERRTVLKKPLPQARRAWKRFPSIGDPGVPKRYSCSPVPIHSWHSTRVV
jgi:endonuclease III